MPRVAIPLLLLWLAACTGGRRPLVPIELPPAPLVDNSPSGAAAIRAERPPPPVTISIPAPRPSGADGAEQRQASDERMRRRLREVNQLLDAYFDFSAYRLRPDAVDAVSKAAADLAEIMAADPALRLVVEGHCDERGSAEFNLALGDRRAESVRELLAQLGIPAARVDTVSYGEAKPQCTEATADCWQNNRRAHVRPAR